MSVEEFEVLRGSKDSVVVELSSLVGLSELKKDMEFLRSFFGYVFAGGVDGSIGSGKNSTITRKMSVFSRQGRRSFGRGLEKINSRELMN